MFIKRKVRNDFTKRCLKNTIIAAVVVFVYINDTHTQLVLLLARLMDQYCFARWRRSSSVVVCNRRRAGQARRRSGGRHSTVGQ